jgi:hypothetical protein
MQDQSHRLFFLAATAAMCAASLYGSQAGPMLFLPGARPGLAVSRADITPAAVGQGLARAVNFLASADSHNQSGEAPTAEETLRNTATIVPNKTSCLPNGGALVSPPAVNSAIGNVGGAAARPAQIPTDAVLGTGSSCPPARGEIGLVEKKAMPSPNGPASRATAVLPHPILHP